MKNIIIPFIAVSLLFGCKNSPQHLVKIEGKQLPVSEKIIADKKIQDSIKPYKEKIDREMNAPISFTPIDLVRTDRELESSLGNLLADLCYQRANPVFKSRTGENIDFAMFNYGGIRAGIAKGEIKYQHAYTMMPFENFLVVVELTGAKIEELVHFLIEGNKAHPLSKQVNLAVTQEGYELKINAKPFEKNNTYFVLTSDFLQNGGDNMNFFKNPVDLYNLDYKVRNAIIDYFIETDTIKVALDGRFRKEN